MGVGAGSTCHVYCRRTKVHVRYISSPDEFSSSFYLRVRPIYKVVQKKPHKVWHSKYFVPVSMLSSIIHHTFCPYLLVRMPHQLLVNVHSEP